MAEPSLLKRFATKIIERDGGCVCRYCGIKLVVRPFIEMPEGIVLEDGYYYLEPGYKVAQIDHVMPRSRGGSNKLDNLVLCCGPCNVDKRARTPDEWAAAKVTVQS
jgi:5-methylcytosine-specific restriction endonuclease McrA